MSEKLVEAAVAAALRKAAAVCESAKDTASLDLEEVKQSILAIPHDDTVLREFGLDIINEWIISDKDERGVVDFLLRGEK